MHYVHNNNQIKPGTVLLTKQLDGFFVRLSVIKKSELSGNSYLVSAQVEGIDSIDCVEEVNSNGFVVRVENKKQRYILPKSISVGEVSVVPILFSVSLGESPEIVS